MQITTVQTEVTQNTEALKGAQVEMSELRRTLQTLEIELESQRSLVRRTPPPTSTDNVHGSPSRRVISNP